MYNMKEILIIILFSFLHFEEAKGQQSLKEADFDWPTRVLQQIKKGAAVPDYGERKNIKDIRKQRKGASRLNILKQQDKERKRDRKVRRRNKIRTRTKTIKNKNKKSSRGNNKTKKNRKHKKLHKYKKGVKENEKEKKSKRKKIKRKKVDKIRKRRKKTRKAKQSEEALQCVGKPCGFHCEISTGSGSGYCHQDSCVFVTPPDCQGSTISQQLITESPAVINSHPLSNASCAKSPGNLLHIMADFYIRFYRTNRRIIRMARRLSDMERIMSTGNTFDVEAGYLASLTNNGTSCPRNPSLSGNVTNTIASLRACPADIASTTSCSQYQFYIDELAARRLGSKTKIGGSFSDCPSTDTACQCQHYFDRNWNRAYTSCTNGATPTNLDCLCYEKLNTEPANPYSDPVDGCQTKNTEKYSDKIDKEIKPLWDNCLLKEAECQQYVSKALELTASCAPEATTVTTAVTTASSVRRKRNQNKFRNIFG